VPNENENSRCPGCDGIQTFTLKAPIARSQAGIGTPNGDMWVLPQQPAWLCNKNRKHHELPRVV